MPGLLDSGIAVVAAGQDVAFAPVMAAAGARLAALGICHPTAMASLGARQF